VIEEPALIDLDVPPERPQRSPRRKVSLITALGLMVAGALAGGAGAAYVVHRTEPVRVVAVSADVAANAEPGVAVTDGQARLKGVLTITNTGTTPISVVDVQMDPAQVSINGRAPRAAIDPGVTAYISATATLTCTRSRSAMGTYAVTVAVWSERSPIPFDGTPWIWQMWKACPGG
jgi:hypothetical protein